MFWVKVTPRYLFFWAKVTPSLGSQTPQILNFPKSHYLKVQNNYVKMSSAFLAYQCLKSLLKVTEVVTYFLGTKSPQGGVTLAQP